MTHPIDPFLQPMATIIAAEITKRDYSVDELESLMRQIYSSLQRVSQYGGQSVAVMQPSGETARIAIEDSVQSDYIICLEDGKKLKMLKRYLKTNYNLTPEEYRSRWGLPASYPMVAPEYAKRRSQLAKDIGLGKEPTRVARMKQAAAGRV